MSGHILTQWRGRVRPRTACGETPAYGLRDICRVGGPWAHFWKPHRTGIGAPHCARPKKRKTQTHTKNETQEHKSEHEIRDKYNKYTRNKLSRKKERKCGRLCPVNFSFIKQLHKQKKQELEEELQHSAKPFQFHCLHQSECISIWI